MTIRIPSTTQPGLIGFETTNLNQASSNLTKSAQEVEAALKVIALSVSSHIQLFSWHSPHGDGYDVNELWYTKRNGKWCLVIKNRSEDKNPANEEEQWTLFNEAPRHL